MDKNLVSIITPTYNCGRFIEETIRSVQAQTYTHWEMLIVDDCSTDNTAEVLQPLLAADTRLHYHRLDVSSGAAVARNTALRMAQGRYIAFLDSDDIWLPDKLAHQLQYMQENGYAFTYHEYDEIDEESRPTGLHVSGKKHVGRWDMMSCCWPGCLSVVYDAEVIGCLQIAPIRKNNDTALWLQAIQKADCYLLPENLARYRRRKGSITPTRSIDKVHWVYRLFREAQHLSAPLAAFWTGMNIICSIIKKQFYTHNQNA